MQKNVIGILIVLSIIGLAAFAYAQRGMGPGSGAHWSGYGHRGAFNNAGMNPFYEKEMELRAELSKNSPDPEKIADLRSEMRNLRNDRGYARHMGWGRGAGSRGPGYCWR